MGRQRKGILSMIIATSLFLNAGIKTLEAVTFESKPTDGSQVSTQKSQSGSSSAETGKTFQKPLLYSVELPQSHKQRLAESLNLMHLTGLQAVRAINMLKEIDGKSLPDNEILARLKYADASLGAVEKAANKVKSDIDIIRIASGNDPMLRHKIALFFMDLLAVPAMAEVSFSSSGSDSGSDSDSDSSDSGSPDSNSSDKEDTGDQPDEDTSYHPDVMDPIESIERIEVADAPADDDSPSENAPIATIRPHGGLYESCMETIYSAAHTLGNAASKMKNDIGEGISSLTGAVGNVHTKIGNVVGQKNWANIMAGTKFAATTAGAVVALVVAAPVVTTAAGMTGLVLATGASFTGAGLSIVNDLQTIENENPDPIVKDLDEAVAKINQGTAFIGLASGSDTFVNLLGVTGGELVGSTPGQEMSDEQLAEFLDRPEHKNALKKQGSLPSYTKPEKKQSEGGSGCH
jgi:hypothetical protein